MSEITETLKMILPFEVNDPEGKFKTLRDDKRLTSGSLMLVDFSHKFYSTSTIPANGSTIKNIAYYEAMQLLSATEAQISPTIVNTITDPTKGLMEFTNKKGLHGIISQVNDLQSGNDFQINIPVAIKNHIFNNPSRGYYVSVWTNRTRLQLQATSANMCLLLSNATNYMCSFEASVNKGTQLGSLFGGNSLGVKRSSLAFNAKTGNPLNDGNAGSGFKFGSGYAYASLEVNKAASDVLYAFHVVDLTSANLTYEEMETLDLKYHTAAFSEGGRFYNDTFTSPSTLP